MVSQVVERVVYRKNLMLRWLRWSSLGVIVVGASTMMSCGAGVLLQTEGEGGVVQYLYQERTGHLLSPNRTSALQRVTQYCGGRYTMMQEGPTRGRRRVVQGVAGDEVIAENWWGIRFMCQAASAL
ncbi:MAG: hypothetical protein ACPGYT_12000 [Nitrospirales bacterium]